MSAVLAADLEADALGDAVVLQILQEDNSLNPDSEC